MKKISILAFFLIFCITSCVSKKNEDPLILPPNFAEMPDLKNPEKPTAAQKDENVQKIKELLLKSDE